MKTILLIGTVDTKSDELNFLRDCILAQGAAVLLMDVGVLGKGSCPVDITNSQVALAANTTLAAIIESGDENSAMTAMAEGSSTLALQAVMAGKVHGVLILGGTMGTDLALDVASALPLGVPKVVLSTVAHSHLIPPERICPDLIMVLWAGGLYGLNSLCKSALAQAAGAVVGAVNAAQLLIEPCEGAISIRVASTFDEARQAAKVFQAQALVNKASGICATVSRNGLDKMLSASAVRKSSSPASHALAIANLDILFENAILGWSKPDRSLNSNIKAVHRFFASIVYSDHAQLVKLTVKETVDVNHANPLYTVESVELNEKSPAVKWVDASANFDEIDLTSIRPAGDVGILAQTVQEFNDGGINIDSQKATELARFLKRSISKKPLIGMTSLGKSCLSYMVNLKPALEARGFEVAVFHTTGMGGRAFEAMAEQGLFAAVLDLSLQELANHVGGSVVTAGSSRLLGAGRAGVPQIVAPGAADMVDFAAWADVPASLAGRSVHVHNRLIASATSPASLRKTIAKEMVQRLNQAKGATALIMPLQGVEAWDRPGEPLYDPDGLEAFTDALRSEVAASNSSAFTYKEVDAHINDDAFCDAVLAQLDAWIELGIVAKP